MFGNGGWGWGTGAEGSFESKSHPAAAVGTHASVRWYPRAPLEHAPLDDCAATLHTLQQCAHMAAREWTSNVRLFSNK